MTESVVWTYTVVEYFEIDNISAPDFVTTYFENITEKGESNKRSEFKDREHGYAVGDDNAFKFFPNIYAYNSDDEEIQVTSYHSVSLVEMKNETEWVALTGSALEDMVAIDEFASPMTSPKRRRPYLPLDGPSLRRPIRRRNQICHLVRIRRGRWLQRL
jgi:hypothetical protein